MNKTLRLTTLAAIVGLGTITAANALTQNGTAFTVPYQKKQYTDAFYVRVTANWAAGPSSAWRQGAMGTTEFLCSVRTGLSTMGNRDYCWSVKETFRTGGYDQNSNTHINVWCKYWDPITAGCNADDSPPTMTHEEKQEIWNYMSGDMTDIGFGGENNLQYMIDIGNASFKDKLEKSISISYQGVAEDNMVWNIFPPDAPGQYDGTLRLDMPVTDYATPGGYGYMIMAVHSLEIIAR